MSKEGKRECVSVLRPSKDAKESTVGAFSDDLAYFIIGHIIRFCNTCYLILRCRRGNMRIKPTAGTSNKIHRNSCFIHIRVGSPELFHPLCHELCILLACRRDVGWGGGFFVFKKVQEKKKEQEAAKPDPDADYVDDNEDYGYDPEYEDDDVDSSVDEDDNEPL